MCLSSPVTLQLPTLPWLRAQIYKAFTPVAWEPGSSSWLESKMADKLG